MTLREGKRTAVFGERPFFDPVGSESLSDRAQRLSAEGADGLNGVNGKTGPSSETQLNN